MYNNDKYNKPSSLTQIQIFLSAKILNGNLFWYRNRMFINDR
jgi:hypothetical protein